MTCESTARLVSTWLKQEMRKNPLRMLGGMLALGAFKALKRKADPDEYGGAVLLGINGICIKAHGGSSANAVRHSVLGAAEFVATQFNNHIIEEIKHLNDNSQQTPIPQSEVETSA